jgi:group I intron endonuclease
MSSGIYAIVNIINGNQYIGSAVNIKKRWNSHVYRLNKGNHHSRHLQNAYLKYGVDNFKFIVLEKCKIKELLNIEQSYLDEYHPAYNTNKIAGNMLGYKFSDEVKNRLIEIRKTFRHTEESKKKMSSIWKGKPRGKYSEERKRRMSEGMKGRKINDNQRRGLEIGQYMKKSEETIKKISDAQKGYKPTEETLEKLRQAWVRRKARIINGL